VSTTVGSNSVDVTVPGGDGISSLTVKPLADVGSSLGGISGVSLIPGVAIEVSATDALGLPIHQLSVGLQITISFRAPSGFSTANAQIYTVDSTDNLQPLTTNVTFLGNGVYSASATTSHLSPFMVYAPPAADPSTVVYLPLVVNGAALPGW
jgi:hypothetical protein